MENLVFWHHIGLEIYVCNLQYNRMLLTASRFGVDGIDLEIDFGLKQRKSHPLIVISGQLGMRLYGMHVICVQSETYLYSNNLVSNFISDV